MVMFGTSIKFVLTINHLLPQLSTGHLVRIICVGVYIYSLNLIK